MRQEVENLADFSPIIEIKDITKTYGFSDATTYALKNFDLTIKRGEFIMIMGPSGCGKTTLLNILGLLDTPSSGDFYLNGTETTSFSRAKKSSIRAKKIGFIFQNFNLINNLTVIDNVALPLVYTGIRKTRRLIKASEVLSRFRLEKHEYYYPYQLSGGQKQRVAIARSLVNRPEIILADEPTGNLDSRNAHIVMEELRNIHSEGNTIIMVTHNPDLTQYATRVIHMLDGQIDRDIKTVSDSNLPQAVKINHSTTPRQELRESGFDKNLDSIINKTERSFPFIKKKTDDLPHIVAPGDRLIAKMTETETKTHSYDKVYNSNYYDKETYSSTPHRQIKERPLETNPSESDNYPPETSSSDQDIEDFITGTNSSYTFDNISEEEPFEIDDSTPIEVENSLIDSPIAQDLEIRSNPTRRSSMKHILEGTTPASQKNSATKKPTIKAVTTNPSTTLIPKKPTTKTKRTSLPDTLAPKKSLKPLKSTKKVVTRTPKSYKKKGK